MSAWLYTCEHHPKGHPQCFKCICGHNFMLFMERENALYPAPFNDWWRPEDREEFANAWRDWRNGYAE
jgi:hypothetical protein